MVKDFIIVTTNCPYCVRWKIAKVLAQSDVDILDYHSGDPRIRHFEIQVPNTSEMLPIGIMKNTSFQSSRDLTFMYVLLRK